MKKVCVVQSRMGNTRYPGKNGLMLCGKPQIWHVLNRIQQCSTFSEIMLAIPHESNGGIQIEAAQELGIPVLDYKGDYNNVVHRYVLAADIMDGDIIIRIPGDNTFVDPDHVDRIVQHYDSDPPLWNILTTNLDTNVCGNGYPSGLGAEVWDVRLLQWLDRETKIKRFREHPHKWAFENDQLATVIAPYEFHAHFNPWMPKKLSLDTPEDWEFTKAAYEALYPVNPQFRIRDLIAFIRR